MLTTMIHTHSRDHPLLPSVDFQYPHSQASDQQHWVEDCAGIGTAVPHGPVGVLVHGDVMNPGAWLPVGGTETHNLPYPILANTGPICPRLECVPTQLVSCVQSISS